MNPAPSSASEIRQRLTAILVADVAGYTRLMAADERATVSGLEAARFVFRAQIELRQGRVVDMAGDSVLAVFETVSGAMGAALAVQQLLAESSAWLPLDRRMRFRIGLHLGDLIEKSDGTVYGDGVNIASRLEGLAEPGGICVSDSVRNAVKSKSTVGFEDLGEQAIKNFPDPIHAFRVSLDPAVHAAGTGLGSSRSDRPSIAVLPFTNHGSDPDQDYFADGVVDDIITALSRIRWFFVIARNSSFTYKGKAVDIKQVGRDLGVRYVLEGSLRRSGKKLRLMAQLIEAENGRHIWADRYDGELEDVFTLQDRITENVVGAIEPNLRLAEYERAQRQPTGSLQAYDLVLRAWQRLSRSAYTLGHDAALTDLRLAIKLDPGYSAAKAMYAWAIQQRTSAIADDRPDEIKDGIRMAREALGEHHNDPVVLSTAGWALSFLAAAHDEAMEAVSRALQIAPNISAVLNHAGWTHVFSGDAIPAAHAFLHAMRVSPLDPQMPHLQNGLAFAYMRAGQFEEALAAASRSIRERPEYYVARRSMLFSLVELGRLDEARLIGKQVRSDSPGFTVSWMMTVPKFRDEAFKLRFVAAMRSAGLPE